jgi:hypothetical protein
MPIYLQNQQSTALKESSERASSLDLGRNAVLGFALDASISMHSLVVDLVSAFNRLIDEQKRINPQASVTVLSFAEAVRELRKNVSLASISPLEVRGYELGPATALNDGIATLIRTLSPFAPNRLTPVLVTILTDGGENHSRTRMDEVKEMIVYRRLQHEWQFIFIGPQSARAYALAIGIPPNSIFSFEADPAGVNRIIDRLSQGIAAYQLGDHRYYLKLHG